MEHRNVQFILAHCLSVYGLAMLLTLVELVSVNSARATNWYIDPGVTIEETYTDNVALSPSGSEESELITVITPGFSLRRESSHHEFELDYSLQNLIYINNIDRNDQLHLLRASSQSEVLDDHFFLDTTLQMSPQNVSNSGNIGSDNFSISDDREDVITYTISPNWQQRLGNYANVDLRYTKDQILSGGELSESTASKMNFNISSGPRFTRLLWELYFDNEEIDNATKSSTRFRNTRGELRYLITRKWALQTNLGYDSNKFSGSENNTKGLIWNVGAVWNPSRRTSFEVTVGERFFGNDLFLAFSHRTRRTRWSANFSMVPDTTRSTLLEQTTFTLNDSFGDPLSDPVIREQTGLNVNVPEQSAEELIRSRFDGVFSYKLRKNELNVTALYEELDFQLSGIKESSRGIDSTWTWNIRRRLNSVLSLGWLKHDLASGRGDEIKNADYRLTWIFANNLVASVGASYVNKTSTNAESEYDENRLFISINKMF